MSRVSYFAALIALACSCTQPPSPPPAPPSNCSTGGPGPAPGPPQPKITEGIAGVICFWEGNFMSTLEPDERGTVKPVPRTIEIHAPTRSADGVGGDGATFWGSVSTPLIATANSGDDGWFEVAVPPGTYSLLVRESGRLYANSFNGEGIIAPIEVTAGKVARTQFDINYRAVE
ncbi:MAG TPA: hypothetical protein VGB85_17220 [Nannocystis sp.]|jgi:hypothetical protein